MKIMGLDISTKTGVVVASAPDKISLELEIEYPKLKGIERSYEIKEHITSIYYKHVPEVVVIEKLPIVRSSTALILAEIYFPILMNLYEMNVLPVMVTTTQLKKFVTGSGRGDKNKMMLEIYKRWGFDPQTDNTADAFALAMIGLASKELISMPKVNMEVIEKITS